MVRLLPPVTPRGPRSDGSRHIKGGTVHLTLTALACSTGRCRIGRGLYHPATAVDEKFALREQRTPLHRAFASGKMRVHAVAVTRKPSALGFSLVVLGVERSLGHILRLVRTQPSVRLYLSCATKEGKAIKSLLERNGDPVRPFRIVAHNAEAHVVAGAEELGHVGRKTDLEWGDEFAAFGSICSNRPRLQSTEDT
jgi:hypothetical protein